MCMCHQAQLSARLFATALGLASVGGASGSSSGSTGTRRPVMKEQVVVVR
jgi:hypothetical protein